MSDSTDAALATERDYEAFERLYQRYLSRIFSLCARLSGSRTMGEELTQDVFVTAWEKLPQLRRETPFGSWLHGLAVDVVLNGKKVDGREADRIEEQGSATEQWNHVATTPNDIERLDLSEAIDRLPASARRFFVLHDVERVRHDEIAEVFGITVGRSRAQLNRARVLLLEALSR
ncbi:MAG: RNA polymerase sigma factor [Gemmatimonadaceae bacterium]